MALGWKILIPFSIVWLLLVATVGRCATDNHSPVVYAVAGVVLVLFVLLITFWDNGYQKHLARLAPERPGPSRKRTSGTTTRTASWSRSRSRRWSRGSRCRRLTCRTITALSLATRRDGSVRGDATGVTKEVTGAGS